MARPRQTYATDRQHLHEQSAVALGRPVLVDESDREPRAQRDDERCHHQTGQGQRPSDRFLPATPTSDRPGNATPVLPDTRSAGVEGPGDHEVLDRQGVRAGSAGSSWVANWVRYSSAYSPRAASSSEWRPRSTMRPSSTTTIWSAPRTVDRRWAITIEVRPASAVSRARWTAASDSESRCAVASSRTTTPGALSSSRASASRCFSPPESRCPRSPTTVSSPCGSDRTRSQTWAARSADSSWASSAAGRAYSRFARTVSWNRCASCVTTPTRSCNDSIRADRRSTPPTRTTPDDGSYSRETSAVIVVLPAPEGPTRATSSPGAALRETSCSTSPPASRSTALTSSSDARETSSAPG